MPLIQIPSFLLQMGSSQLLQIIGIIIPLWAVGMIILERLFPYTPNIKLFRRGFWMDLVWYTIIQSKVMEIIIFYNIIFPLKNYLGLAKTGILSHWNFYLLIFFFFITHDFYIYWFHRLQHSVAFFWRTHEAHHSGREVDFLAGSRSHFTEILINQTIEFAPIFFLLDSHTSAFVYPIKAMIDALWGMWIHANINVNSGPLQYIINGPEMHQWHHANHCEVFHRNFSTKLAIWDWLFGTAYLPSLKPLNSFFTKPKMFGLPYRYPKGFFGQTVFAFFRFNISKLETWPPYLFILHLRMNITSFLFSIFGVQEKWIENKVFDNNNSRYFIDNQQHICLECKSQKVKYFYQSNKLVLNCLDCGQIQTMKT